MADEPNCRDLWFLAGSVFTPGAPINERELFAGRSEQVDKVLDAISQRGYHAVLYGERGVGKTSLANMMAALLRENTKRFVFPRINCDSSDDYSSLWRKALQDLQVMSRRSSAGFAGSEGATENLIELMPDEIAPDDVRRALTEVAVNWIVLITFDEFDRITDPKVTLLMADTIKMLSDYGIAATILIIGVADSVDELIQGHQSVERALVQIPMPRMSLPEIDEILNRGLERLGMTANETARESLRTLSQGLPFVAHLLGLHSVRTALNDERLEVTQDDVTVGVGRALDQWQESVRISYNNAVKSPQPGNIYREVVLACALAEVDDMGFFSPAAVRTPLRGITGKDYDIPNYSRHLKELSETNRGAILQRVGDARRFRYRFASPILKSYVVMRGVRDELLPKKQIQTLISGLRSA